MPLAAAVVLLCACGAVVEPAGPDAEPSSSQTIAVFADAGLEAAVRAAVGGQTDPLHAAPLARNRVVDLAPLIALPDLRLLVLDGNPVADLMPLLSLDSLSSVELAGVDAARGGEAPTLAALHERGVRFTFTDTAGGLAVRLPGDSGSAAETDGVDAAAAVGEDEGVEAAPEIVFADSSLEALVRRQLGDVDGPLKRAQALTLTWLWDRDPPGDRPPIARLQGLEHCTNLAQLYLNHSEISDLQPLAGLPSLVGLGLADGHIVDLSPLVALTAIVSLSLGDSQIESLKPLRGMRRLRSLRLAGNRIVDLAPLTGADSLDYVDITGNAVADLSPLAGKARLEKIEANFNEIDDLSPLASMSGLKFAYLARNRIADLTPVAYYVSTDSALGGGLRPVRINNPQ